MTTLVLNLKAVYFNQIKAGTKPFEYRLVTPHWTKRLVDREYGWVEFVLGYAARGELHKRIHQPYLGYELQTIQHEHFGPEPVEVFAIRVRNECTPSPFTFSTSTARSR